MISSSKSSHLLTPSVRRRWAWIALILTLITNIILAILKTIIGILINSVSLIADGIDSFFDLGTGFLAFLGIQLSSKPADEDHHFGHEKIEIFSTLVIVLVLLLSGTLILIEAGKRLLLFTAEQVIEISFIGFGIVIVSIVAKFFLASILFRIARITNSSSIKADATNSRMDSITSFSVLIALVSSYFGLFWVDSLVGAGIAFLIYWAAVKLLREVFRVLLDEAPPGIVEKIIRLSEHYLPEVDNIHNIRIRSLGTRIIADCHIHVNPRMSVGEAHKIMLYLEEIIYRETIINEILIHVEPTGEPC